MAKRCAEAKTAGLERKAAALTAVAEDSVPTAAATQERKPHLALGVVPVGVHQDHRLPRPQLQAATQHRKRRMGRNDGREDVVPAMTGGAVPMLPTVVRREDLVEGGQEVVVTARSGLDHG
ncbi:hypothetical protein SMD44_08244 [Streptomyces alboflavus]|uniref:Uncharacterized protein n=1 Tax=Streptomyces alboflavus TaxID=67267 RepID=A0A1Z1WQS7_9ACTN|nr:hypothetical protein SMD44_08244 [Streptomyces alboflavus]